MPYTKIYSFTGGINTRTDSRRLKPNKDEEGVSESPDMENMDITLEGALITSTGFTQVSNLLSISDLVGNWKFDEGAGAAAYDSSENSNDGTITTATYAAGQYDTALTFNGTSGNVMVTDDSAIQDVWDGGGTVSAWINPNSDGESSIGVIVSKETGPANGWLIDIINDNGTACNIRFLHNFSGTDGTWVTTGRPVTLNTWSHVVITYDSDAVANNPIIYIDNVAIALTETSTPGGTRLTDVGTNLYIGNYSDDARTFDGEIDEVAMFDKALSVAEVASLFNNPGQNITESSAENVKALLNYEKDEDDRFLIVTIDNRHYSITPTDTALSDEWLGEYGTEAAYVGGTVYLGAAGDRLAILGTDVTANTIQNSDLATAMANLSDPPAQGYIMTVFMGRLFIATGTTLHYSDVDDEDDFAGGGTIGFNDIITGLKVEGKRIIVFTRTYHQGVFFDYDDSFNLSVPLKEAYERKYGALGHKTIQEVYPNVFYWSDEGVMMLGSEQSYESDNIPRPQSISRKVDPSLNFANKGFRRDATAAQFDQKYWLAIPYNTDNFNSRTFVYDLNWDAWTLRTGLYPTDFALFRNSDYKQELYFGDFFSPTLYRFDDSYSYNGFGYTRKWVSKRFTHGDHNTFKEWRWVDITGSMDAGTELDVTLRVDNNELQYQIDNTHLETDAFGEYIGDNFLGDALLGGSEPEDARFKRFRARIPFNSTIREGYEMQMTLENSEAEQPWKIDFIGIRYEYRDIRQIPSNFINNQPLP